LLPRKVGVSKANTTGRNEEKGKEGGKTFLFTTSFLMVRKIKGKRGKDIKKTP